MRRRRESAGRLPCPPTVRQVIERHTEPLIARIVALEQAVRRIEESTGVGPSSAAVDQPTTSETPVAMKPRDTPSRDTPSRDPESPIEYGWVLARADSI